MRIVKPEIQSETQRQCHIDAAAPIAAGRLPAMVGDKRFLGRLG
jgi:hypothetical protein